MLSDINYLKVADRGYVRFAAAEVKPYLPDILPALICAC